MSTPETGRQASLPLSLVRPLKLPRFTFIISGDLDKNHALANLMLERDDDIALSYIRWPLMDCASGLLSTIIEPTADPNSSTPLGPLKEVLGTLETTLHTEFGPEALGKLFVAYAEENHEIDNNVVVIDAATHHLAPIISAFGLDNICVILLGSLQQIPPELAKGAKIEGTNFIWLAHDDLQMCMKNLERELGVL